MTLRHIGRSFGLVRSLQTNLTLSVRERNLFFFLSFSPLFDKRCTASKVTDFAQLHELLLLEEFKTCLPEKNVVYLNKQKAFSPVQHERTPAVGAGKLVKPSPKSPQRSTTAFNSCEYFYCHETGHLIANCPPLQESLSRHNKLTRLWLTVSYLWPKQASACPSAYSVNNNVLMHNWCSVLLARINKM